MQLDVSSIYNNFPHYEDFQFNPSDNLYDAHFERHTTFDEAYQGCVNDLKQFILHKSRQNRFGFHLLHRHFKLKPGEIFLEGWTKDDQGEPIHVTEPVFFEEYQDQIIFTHWIKLDSLPFYLGLVARSLKPGEQVQDSLAKIKIPGNQVTPYPPTFYPPGQITYPVINNIPDTFTQEDMQCLWAMGSALRRSNMNNTHRFGINVLEEAPVFIDDKKILLEETNEKERKLIRRIVEKQATPPDRTYVYTNWQVDAESESLVGLSGCRINPQTGKHVKDIDTIGG